MLAAGDLKESSCHSLLAHMVAGGFVQKDGRVKKGPRRRYRITLPGVYDTTSVPAVRDLSRQ